MVLLCNQRTKGAQSSLVPDPLDTQSKEEKAQHQPSCVKDRQPRGLALEQPLAHSWNMDGLLLRAPVQRARHRHPGGTATVAREGSSASSPLPTLQPHPRSQREWLVTYKLDRMPRRTLKKKVQGQDLIGTCVGGSGRWRPEGLSSRRMLARPQACGISCFFGLEHFLLEGEGTWTSEGSSSPSPG